MEEVALGKVENERVLDRALEREVELLEHLCAGKSACLSSPRARASRGRRPWWK